MTGFTAGGAYNVVASDANLKGTIRSGHEATRRYAWSSMPQILSRIAEAHNATVDVKLHRGEPPVINDPAMVEIVREASVSRLGAGHLVSAPGWTAADDFAFYSEKCPSVYFRLGIRNSDAGSIYPLHHPKFRVDERAPSHGVMVLKDTALRFLQHLP